MKSTGIIRKVDELGRIVIPIELRRNFDIEIKDPIEIFVNDDQIVLKKYVPACIFCGQDEEVETFKNKKVCKDCLEEINKNY